MTAVGSGQIKCLVKQTEQGYKPLEQRFFKHF